MAKFELVDPRASLRLEDKYQRILDTSLAKPRYDWRFNRPVKAQSYFDHVTDVYLVWKQLVDIHRRAIDRVAERAEINSERLLQSSLLCVALHDVGKLTRNFLDMVEATSKTNYRAAQKRNYRHEIAVLPLLDAFTSVFDHIHKQFPMIGGGNLEVLAVAGHHGFLADGYLFCEERFSNRIIWEPQDASAFEPALRLARKMFCLNGWRLPGISRFNFDLLTHSGEQHSNSPFLQLIHSRDACAGSTDRHRFRDVFAVLKGLLMVSDWRASAGLNNPGMLNAVSGSVRIPRKSLHAFIEEKLRFDGKVFTDYRDFQKECGNATAHVLAIAPTGSGKTEAAFLWALNQIESGHAKKVLFLLPTMVTANSVYERAKAFFETKHQHTVGLLHSTADLVRQVCEINDEHDVDNSQMQNDVLAERHFFYPVTVGTIDQLLNSLFHSGRWAMKAFAAMDAAIIIDEVHAYDPHTTGLVSLMLEQLSAAGSRFMVMSATMPTGLRSVIRKSIVTDPNAQISEIADQELLDQARNDWQARDIRLTDWLLDNPKADLPKLSTEARKSLRREIEKGNRVLIIVNTVQRCQDIATAVQRDFPTAVCYHSKFIFKDRRELERRITAKNSEVRILTATQVVEVSLDIDFG